MSQGLRRPHEAVDYAALLRSHIAKEDGVLYPMARDLLPVLARLRECGYHVSEQA